MEWSEPDDESPNVFHSWCGRCVEDGQYQDDATVCHPACLETEEDQEETDALLEAAYALDEATLLRATIDSPQLASLNLERGSVQLVGCENRILANIPIDRAAIQEFQAEFAPIL